MVKIRIFTCAALLFTMGFSWPVAAKDCSRFGQPIEENKDPDPCGYCQSDCNGKLLTYNPDNGRTLSEDVLALKNDATAAGAPPISCIRPQHCQDQLIKCFAECGQEGRAAKISKHADGAACDWSLRHIRLLEKLRAKYPNLQELVHGECGAGLHDYTTQYVPSPVGDHPQTWDSK